jgi:amino acid permease
MSDLAATELSAGSGGMASDEVERPLLHAAAAQPAPPAGAAIAADTSSEPVAAAAAAAEAKASTGTIFSSAVNLSNTIIGVGILGIPYAMSQWGYILGLILLIICAGGAAFGLLLLTLACDKIPANTLPSYDALAARTYPKARHLVDLAIALKCIGVATAFLIVIGQLVVASAGSEMMPRWAWTLVLGVAVVPLAYLPKIDHLRFSSYVGFGTIAYLVVIVLRGWGQVGTADTSPALATVSSFTAFFTFVFSFTCHQNGPTIYGELKDRSLARMARAIGYSVLGSLSLYVTVGLVGYMTFGSTVPSDLLTAYQGNDVPVNICRVLMAVHVATCYPLQANPFRIAVAHLFGCELWDPNFPNSPKRYHFMITTVFLIVTFAIAASTDNLGLVFNLIGATGSNLITYVLPALFYEKITRGEHDHPIIRVIAFGLIWIGIAFLITDIIIVILHFYKIV